MRIEDTPTLTDALHALTPCIDRMRRNIGHIVQPAPEQWRRAAASALVYNARQAANIADCLSDCPRPAKQHVRMVQDLRAVDLGRQVDRIKRLWEEKADGEPLEDIARILAALRYAVRLCRLRCSNCDGTGEAGNGVDACPACSGTGQPTRVDKWRHKRAFQRFQTMRGKSHGPE